MVARPNGRLHGTGPTSKWRGRGGRLSWAVADVEVGSTPDVDTFICIGSQSFLGAGVRITLHYDDGTVSTQDPRSIGDCFTLWPRHDFPESVGRRFAMTIESLEVLLAASPSLPRGRVPIIVEKVTYRGNFEAGAASRAQPGCRILRKEPRAPQSGFLLRTASAVSRRRSTPPPLATRLPDPPL